MSLRIENELVTDGQRLNNRIITMRSQSIIPTYVFRRTVLKVDEAAEEDRRFVTWSGLGSIVDSDEHAIDYEPLGHAMVLILDAIGGAFHNGGMMVIPEEFSALALVEPYDIKLEGDDREDMRPNWTPQVGDLFCFLLNNHKEYHECTGIMGQSMLASHGAKYALAQRFDLNYLEAFKEEKIADVVTPYE